MKTITVDDAIAYLNDALKCDPEAMTRLIASRVPCNQLMADHPTVQCGQTETGHEIGPLGLFNGLFGIDDRGYGFIAAIMDNPAGIILEFRRFRETDRNEFPEAK